MPKCCGENFDESRDPKGHHPKCNNYGRPRDEWSKTALCAEPGCRLTSPATHCDETMITYVCGAGHGFTYSHPEPDLPPEKGCSEFCWDPEAVGHYTAEWTRWCTCGVPDRNHEVPFQPGDRIRLVKWSDEYSDLGPNSLGTITSITACEMDLKAPDGSIVTMTHQIAVDWDERSKLHVCWPQDNIEFYIDPVQEIADLLELREGL